MIANLKKLWKNEYIQTAIIIGFIALAVFGFWYGSQVALNTPHPALAVESGSMCIPYNVVCDGWLSVSHPFDRTLHKGDLIIIQGVNPQELNADYPNSDIIVFHQPEDVDVLIVHRIVAKKEIDGVLYFDTKGDGNGAKWPSTPDRVDPWSPVSEDLVVGKVIMRIPWVGYIVLFMQHPAGLPIVIALIILLVIVEFILPLLKGKKPTDQQQETQQQP